MVSLPSLLSLFPPIFLSYLLRVRSTFEIFEPDAPFHVDQDASTQITQLLSSLTDNQRSYLNALTTYRSSLKEVLGKEVALRTVVRDREILVNRVIKLGNKKPKDERLHDHQMKLEDAQRELTACEST